MKWRDEIVATLGSAKVAVLLVTPDFLGSEFVQNDELPSLLAAAESGGLTIFWVPVRPSLVNRTPLGAYQAVGSPARPLSAMGE